MRHALPFGAALAALLLITPAAAASTSDPLSDRQWGLDQIRAERAWETSTGAGVVIAVVDTGVDLTHPDLRTKLVAGATFVGCGKRPAPCGDGDWKGVDGVGQPSDVHGTHVAGIAAARTNNRTGVAGVAPDAKVMPVKVLEDGTGSFDDIAKGIRWSVDHGAEIINLSLGALPGVQALVLTGVLSDVQEAISYASDRGVAIVAAAGNEAAPLCDTPSFDRGALCVAATDRNELKAWYSNLAFKLDNKVVAAPGGAGLRNCNDNVWSTVPQGTGSDSCGQADYDAFAGTSMAAPHVAGVAALLYAQGRDLADVENALLTTARNPLLLGLRGVPTLLYGRGIVDAEAAVAAPRKIT
ncbi:hypothetical protein GCM10012275_10310 [Longimycelium tulufanense]|uniref:Peptidase S8/S53 domain-containing protein n=1 Tax=Longimycelium tulufanense TaxID=907463 RepID=A0A8J3FU79_9PSEU|nr:S8 family peptidase [Longimycelium tulufanense]GGM41232.1 hypothetical protein GCM10012275_10310 [Longimycelium tulufanense]